MDIMKQESFPGVFDSVLFRHAEMHYNLDSVVTSFEVQGRMCMSVAPSIRTGTRGGIVRFSSATAPDSGHSFYLPPQ